jgi:secondary thiamine-phosphate synthase enzyme
MLQGKITITSVRDRHFIDITHFIEMEIAGNNIQSGICFLFNPHTTAGLTINEGCDPAVKDDIIVGLQRIVPLHLAYQHQEGNSPAHIMASLLGSSLTVFIDKGHLLLGAWQKIFFCEFDGPRSRTVHWRVLKGGESAPNG